MARRPTYVAPGAIPMQETQAHRWSFVRRLALVVSLSLVSLEVLARVAVRAIGLDRRRGGMVMEAVEGVPSFTFDPLIGYRLPESPVRMLAITPSGRVQSVGEVKGNNRGFPDGDDFRPKRRTTTTKRIAVFGDSMTAGIYLRKNWPARTQMILEQEGKDVEILNFAVDGGGIMNWWSILARLLAPEEYQLDGLVIAVCCDDLSRGLFIRHDDCRDREHLIMQGRVRGLKPDDLPGTLDEARRQFFMIPDSGGHGTAEIDDAIAGRASIEVGVSDSSLLTLLVVGLFLNHFQSQGIVPGPVPFTADLIDRMEEMRAAAERLSLPIAVIQVPMQDHEGSLPGGVAPATRAFADILHATLWDGHEAFADVPPADVGDYFLIGDPHFNQRGSDRFASHVAKKLESWP